MDEVKQKKLRKRPTNYTHYIHLHPGLLIFVIELFFFFFSFCHGVKKKMIPELFLLDK